MFQGRKPYCPQGKIAMSHAYEMIYILRPDLPEEQVKEQVARYETFLGQYNVQDLTSKIWGKRRLAYPIKKFQDGIYVQLNYQAEGQQVAPLEREMRLSEEVIRFLTVRLETKTPKTGDDAALVEDVEEEEEETVAV